MAKDAGTPSLMAAGALEALRGAMATGKGDSYVPELVDYFTQRMSPD